MNTDQGTLFGRLESWEIRHKRYPAKAPLIAHTDAAAYPFRGCWSCGAHGSCHTGCQCAKCRDPADYAAWKIGNPDAYQAWRASQQLGPGEPCTCPGCR